LEERRSGERRGEERREERGGESVMEGGAPEHRQLLVIDDMMAQ